MLRGVLPSLIILVNKMCEEEKEQTEEETEE